MKLRTKLLFALACILMFVPTVFGRIYFTNVPGPWRVADMTSNDLYVEDQMRWTPHDNEPDAVEGYMYYDLSENAPAYYDGSGWVVLTAAAGSPAGSDTQMQYNNSGSFGAIATIIWDDTNLVFLDDQTVAFGTAVDWTANFDDSAADQLLWETANTQAITTTDPMFQILVDTGNPNGTGMTANQQVFGIAKGSQGSNVDLLTLDEDGDFSVAGTIAGTFVGDITLSSAETITNVVDSEIAFAQNAGENIIFDMDAGANAVGLKSTTGVDELAMGDVDDLTGVGTIVFDAEDSTITLPSDGTDDLTIAVTGGFDTRLLLQSSGTEEDAIAISTSSGGMTLTVVGASGSEDLTLSSNTAVNILSSQASNLAINIATSNPAGQIVISSADTTIDGIDIDSAGGIDIDAVDDVAIDNSGAGKNITLISTLGSIYLDAGEAIANAIVIDASNDAGGGIDVDFGTGNLVIVGNTAGADMTIDVDSFSIDGVGASNITVTSNAGSEDFIIALAGATDSSLILSSTGDGADALQIVTLTNGGGIDIIADGDSGDAGDLDIINTNGSINLSSGEAIADSFTIASTGGVDISSSASYDIDLTATGGAINLITTETALGVRIDAQGAVAGNAIEIEATSGGITLLADHVDDGDITLDAEDVITFITEDSVVVSGGPFIESIESLSSDGVNLLAYGVSDFDTNAGAFTYVLPDAAGGLAAIGQIKVMTMSVAGNDADITVTNHVTTNPEVFRFNAVDEALVLMWTGAEWMTIANADVDTP